MHSIPAVGRRGRRIDFCEVASIQRPIRRPRECVASHLGPCCLQVRFQPLRALTVETVTVVVSFGVETSIGDVVLSAVDILSHCSRDEVSPLRSRRFPRGGSGENVSAQSV